MITLWPIMFNMDRRPPWWKAAYDHEHHWRTQGEDAIRLAMEHKIEVWLYAKQVRQGGTWHGSKRYTHAEKAQAVQSHRHQRNPESV